MNTKKEQTLEEKIKELKQQIKEFRSWRHDNVADMFEEELRALLAMHKLGTGVKTVSQLKELA